jgi:hypothetical protein
LHVSLGAYFDLFSRVLTLHKYNYLRKISHTCACVKCIDSCQCARSKEEVPRDKFKQKQSFTCASDMFIFDIMITWDVRVRVMDIELFRSSLAPVRTLNLICAIFDGISEVASVRTGLLFTCVHLNWNTLATYQTTWHLILYIKDMR